MRLLQSRNTDELGCTTGTRLYTPETEHACNMNMNIAIVKSQDHTSSVLSALIGANM